MKVHTGFRSVQKALSEATERKALPVSKAGLPGAKKMPVAKAKCK